MREKRIDIRELRETLETRIAEVQDGANLVITEDGKPVARLSPMARTTEEKLHGLVQSGLISWSGQKPSRNVPTFPVQGSKTVAEMLVEDRG